MATPSESTLAILRRNQVEARTGLSRASIYAGVKAGTFPKPVNLGPNSVGWLEHEISGWLAARIAQRDQAAA
jgi:prophage regulatory protein